MTLYQGISYGHIDGDNMCKQIIGTDLDEVIKNIAKKAADGNFPQELEINAISEDGTIQQIHTFHFFESWKDRRGYFMVKPAYGQPEFDEIPNPYNDDEWDAFDWNIFLTWFKEQTN